MSKTATTEDVLRAGIKAWGTTSEVINKKTRRKRPLRMRQMIQYVSRYLTLDSLEEIGVHTGKKNHATVLHSYRKIINEREMYDDIVYMEEQVLDELDKMGFRTTPPPLPILEDRLEQNKYNEHCPECGQFVRIKGGCVKCRNKSL